MKMPHILNRLVLAMGFGAVVSIAQADLLGLTPSEPLIDFPNGGMIDYDATTGVVTISGSPNLLSQLQTEPFLFSEFAGTSADNAKEITVKFYVDANGNLLHGVDDAPDLIVTGSVDVDYDGIPDYDGILLEGEVTQFGFQDGGADADQFDLRFTITSGLLNGGPNLQNTTTSSGLSIPPLFGINDLALSVASEIFDEYPTPFSGSFAESFTGAAKGNLGSTVALPPSNDPCQINVEAYCSVDGSPNADKCRIKLSKSAKHWEHHWFEYHGRTCRKVKYGMHNQSVPSWANRYPTTDVLFTYVVTNTGTTTINNLLVDDSFDSELTGVPATLAPGESVTLTRTEALNEKLENVVNVMGESVNSMCSDMDAVVIRDKLRDRRRFDDDGFRDKGKRDHH